MNTNLKIYFITLGISLLIFILEVFILKITGALGLILCVTSFYFLIASSIRLIRLTNLIKSNFLEKIDILFF